MLVYKYNWKKGTDEIITISSSPFSYVPDSPRRIYRFEGEGKISIADSEKEIYSGGLPYEPTESIVCDSLTFTVDSEITITLITEVGSIKATLEPFINTSDGMEVINDGYNDDSTFGTEGLPAFKFNGIEATNVYISSNTWIGFGVSSSQLLVLQRDACSMALYRQVGVTSTGVDFLKLRFDGYTVRNRRTDATRLVYELFILSSGDMFLNLIQTPTNTSYLGNSSLVCGSTTTKLELADGSGAGKYVSFYRGDSVGKSWNIVYEMYEEKGEPSHGYLIKGGSTYYTIRDGKLVACSIENLTAAMFLKYGISSPPASELLVPLTSPEVFSWSAGDVALMKATVNAYPYPQKLSAVADMSSESILSIGSMLADYTGEVGVCVSYDDGATYESEVLLSDWMQTDVTEIWNSLPEDKKLYLQFVLHEGDTLKEFKITYNN